MIIGIDLDGTLANDENWIAPDVIADPNPNMVNVVQALHDEGHRLYVFSCRADYIVKQWLNKHGLLRYFEGINYSPGTSDSIKPNFDYYIGDDALTWTGNNSEAILNTIRTKPNPNRFTTDRDEDFMSHQPVPYLAGTGRAYLDMFEQDWRELWRNHDTQNKKVAFMTICSHAKPYSKSFIHTSIRHKLHTNNLLDSVDYIHISNAGIIPSSGEMVYPFNAYDHDGSQMSESIMKYFSEVLEERMKFWADNYANKYDHIVVYLRKGKTYRSTESGLFGHNPIMVEAFVEPILEHQALPDPDDCLTSENNLNRLTKTLHEIIS